MQTGTDLIRSVVGNCRPDHECPYCTEDVGPVALVDLVYTFESCGCSAEPFTHLTEVIWHRECFVDAFEPREAPRTPSFDSEETHG